MALKQNLDILSVDLRDNPGFKEKTDYNKYLKNRFLFNIRQMVLNYHKEKQGMRIKLEWIFGHCIGLCCSKFETMQPKYYAVPNRRMFNMFISQISKAI